MMTSRVTTTAKLATKRTGRDAAGANGCIPT